MLGQRNFLHSHADFKRKALWIQKIAYRQKNRTQTSCSEKCLLLCVAIFSSNSCSDSGEMESFRCRCPEKGKKKRMGRIGEFSERYSLEVGPSECWVPSPTFYTSCFTLLFHVFSFFLCNYSYVFLFLLNLGKSFQASKNQEFLSRTISCCKYFQVGYL